MFEREPSQSLFASPLNASHSSTAPDDDVASADGSTSGSGSLSAQKASQPACAPTEGETRASHRSMRLMFKLDPSDDSDGDCVWLEVPAAKRQRATASGDGAGRTDMMQQTLEMTRVLGSQSARAPVAGLDPPNRDTVSHSRDLSSALPTQLSSACVMFEPKPSQSLLASSLNASDSFTPPDDDVASADGSTEKAGQSACAPTEGETGASHRSMRIMFKLAEPTAKGTHPVVEETNDSAASLNYMVIALAIAIAERCPECVVDRGRYKTPQVTFAADSGQMQRVGFIKLKFVVRDVNQEEHEFTRRYEVLTTCILQCIHGIQSQSEERGFLDIHNVETSSTSPRELYVAREPATVLIPLFRSTNHLLCSF